MIQSVNLQYLLKLEILELGRAHSYDAMSIAFFKRNTKQQWE
ncbi:MAG: hypothetical protein EZS28_049842, partial [Streblomastix strix]